MSKFIREKLYLNEDEDIEITNDKEIDAIKDSINPADVIENDMKHKEQEHLDLANKVMFTDSMNGLTSKTFEIISMLNGQILGLKQPLKNETGETVEGVLDVSEVDHNKILSLLDEILVQENVNVGLYQQIVKIINPETLAQAEDTVTDEIKDANLDTTVKDTEVKEGLTKPEINLKKIQELMNKLKDEVVDWCEYVNNVNQDARTDRTLEKIVELTKQIDELYKKNYELIAGEPFPTSDNKVDEVYEYHVKGDFRNRYGRSWRNTYRLPANSIECYRPDYEGELEDCEDYKEGTINKEIFDGVKKFFVEHPKAYSCVVVNKKSETKTESKMKSNNPVKKLTEADNKTHTIADVMKFSDTDSLDIGDEVFDWGENIDYIPESNDGYNRVMKYFINNIECIKYSKDWYSTCKVSEFIEKNIDKFNTFLNEAYQEQYQPQNQEKQYTIKEDPEEFYDMYMDMMSSLLRGSFATSDYDLLADILEGKKPVVSGQSSVQYIYQFPQGTTEEDIKEAESKYNLKYLGKVGPDGYQPGDIIIQGTKANLEKFCDEYLAYEMHPDYLYKTEDFDTDILESLNVNKGEGDYLAELSKKIGLNTLQDLKDFIEYEKKEGKDTSDVLELLVQYNKELENQPQ